MPHAANFRRSGIRALLAFALASPLGPIAARDVEPAPRDPDAEGRLGDEVVTKLRIGAIIKARGAAAHNIRLVVPTPLVCREQEAEVLDEEITPNVERAEPRELNEGTSRQIVIELPALGPGQEARAVTTYEVRTRTQLPPKETESLHIPWRPEPALRRYLGPSPFIETRHGKIRAAVKEALAEFPERPRPPRPKPARRVKATTPAKASGSGTATSSADADAADNGDAAESSAADAPPVYDDWRRVEAIYDYVQAHVTYEEGEDKSALQTLADGKGDCQAISALFIAMCRTAEVPARTVWVDAHQYAEFYLLDGLEYGRWYPIESAGPRAFGAMPTARVILQKGDNFRVPDRRREILRYPSNYYKYDAQPQAQPKVTFVMEPL